MTSDYIDYPPKSADDLNKQGRESDVLISALEKCAKLKKENKQLRVSLKECHRFIKSVKFSEECFMPKCQQDLLIKINAAIGESEE